MRPFPILSVLSLLLCARCASSDVTDVVTPGEALAASHAAPTAAKGRTLLLVDDHNVLYRAGTQRVAHPAKRLSNIALIAPDKPWEIMLGWTGVYRNPDTGKYQLWYQSYLSKQPGLPKPLQSVICYAESDDGIHFTKPMLGLYPFKDQKQTNIIMVGNDIPGAGDRYGCSVIVEPHEKDPAKRYKMVYYDWSMVDGQVYPGLHVCFSADGIHWSGHQGPLRNSPYARNPQQPFADEPKVVVTPVAGKPPRMTFRYPLEMSDACDLFRDPVRQSYVIYGKMWMDSPDGSTAWKHVMGRLESKDFIHWSKPQVILTPDDRDPPDRDFHTTPVFFYNDAYFCLNPLLNRKGTSEKDRGTIDIELATSRDGFKWERNYRDELFLPHNPADDVFDGRAILSNPAPVILDDEIRFYYGAYNTTPIGGGYEKYKVPPKSGVGLATIPRDRFGGVRTLPRSEQTTLLKPLENIGQVTLKPLDLKGVKGITVNADASNGSVHVELLDADGYRVRGFAKDDASAIQGDGLRHAVKWKDKSVGDLTAGQYMLRVHLDNATLYAVTFQ